MPLPQLVLLSAAGPLLDLRIAQVDASGGQELVLATAGARPEAVVLEVVHLGPEGETGRTRHPLPERAAWWDAGHGLWLADGSGLLELRSGRRVSGGATGLPTSGRGAPTRAWLVTDLDHDDQPELLSWSPDAVQVHSVDGAAWGAVPAPPRTELTRESRAGGQVLRTSLVAPAVALADVDGDGDDDVLVIDDAAITVHRTGPGAVSVEQVRWPLPEVLAPPAGPGGWLDAVPPVATWQDLTGDGLADLLVHRARSEGRLATTTSEVVLLPGRGFAGLGPPQVVTSRVGAQEAYVVDLDADGDGDVLVPRIRLDVGNLAQAVVSRSVEIELAALPMQAGRLGEPVVLRQVTMPLEDSRGAAWSLFEDLTGDGLKDLALAAEGRLRVWPGGGLMVGRQAVVDLELPITVEHLWAADLTGDGAPELVVWAPGSAQVAVVRLR